MRLDTGISVLTEEIDIPPTQRAESMAHFGSLVRGGYSIIRIWTHNGLMMEQTTFCKENFVMLETFARKLNKNIF